MANIKAAQTGNWSATSTWTGGVVPVSGDNVSSNNFTVTIDVNATVANVTNGTAYGATTGGNFVLNNGITFTANVISNSANTALIGCVVLSGTNSATIVGNIAAGSGFSNSVGVLSSSTGTLTISCGTISGGYGGNADGVRNTSSGTITITTSGGITGGNTTGGFGIQNSNTGTIIVAGNVTGGANTNCNGVNNASTGSVTITGNVIAGSSVSGANNASTGAFTIIGDITAVNGVNGFTSSNSAATNRLSGSFISSPNGTAAIYATKYILNSTPLNAKTRYALNGTSTYVDMFTADNTSGITGVATTDVRLGVSYGGGLVGTCAVPPASAVAAGTAVGSSLGTATLTAADVRSALGLASANLDTQLAALPTSATNATAVWGAAARTITGGTVDTLTNAPSVPTAASIASATRTELATELARVDVATSTRLAGSAYTAPSNSDVTAIKAKTDLLNTDRLAQASTVATTGAQIAAALS